MLQKSGPIPYKEMCFYCEGQAVTFGLDAALQKPNTAITEFSTYIPVI